VIGSADTAAGLGAGLKRRSALVRYLAVEARQVDRLATVGLVAAALVFYYPLVFLGRAIVDYDAFVYFYPQRTYLARSLLQGQIPLWNPDLFLGAPFLANPQTAVLYPPSWLFLFGPAHAVYGLQLVLHAFLAAWFTYLLARRAFDVRAPAAVVGGLAYAFGGFAVGQLGHLNQISAAAWLPAVLLAYHGFVTTLRPHWLGLGAIALGLQLFAGHPQETYMTLIVLGIFGIVMAPWQRPRHLALTVGGGLLMCALGGALAAAQLLPTLELAPLSIRGEGVSWKDAVAGSLPLYLAVRALFPPFWISVPNTEYLGYTGVTAMVLGLLALAVGRVRAVVFGVTICFIGLLLALGENTGPYEFLFDIVPGLDTFRVPARWLLVWQFGVAVLAAVGADWIARGARLQAGWLVPTARLAVVVVLVIIAIRWQTDEGEAFVQRRTPGAWIVIAVATLAVGALPRLRRPMLAAGLLVALAGGELWAAADASPARQAPPPAFRAGESVDWLLANGAPGERVLSLARPEYVPASEPALRAMLGPLPEHLVFSVIVAQKWRDTLTPNVPMQFGLSTADGYDGGVLPLLRWVRLSTLVVPEPRADGVLLSRMEQLPDARVVDLLGVRYLITNRETPGRADLQTVDFGDLRLHARPEPVPRSLVVFDASAADDQTALALMARADFDPNREVVLTDAATPKRSTRAGEPVVPLVQQPHRFVARIALPEPGYLVQREAWYPGWRARVDGVETPVQRANVLFRAVQVPAGEHEVEVYFQSDSFLQGLAVSLGAIVLIGGLLVWQPRRSTVD